MIAEYRPYLCVGYLITAIFANVGIKLLNHSSGKGFFVGAFRDLKHYQLEACRYLRSVRSLGRGEDVVHSDKGVALSLHIGKQNVFVKGCLKSVCMAKLCNEFLRGYGRYPVFGLGRGIRRIERHDDRP